YGPFGPNPTYNLGKAQHSRGSPDRHQNSGYEQPYASAPDQHGTCQSRQRCQREKVDQLKVFDEEAHAGTPKPTPPDGALPFTTNVSHRPPRAGKRDFTGCRLLDDDRLVLPQGGDRPRLAHQPRCTGAAPPRCCVRWFTISATRIRADRPPTRALPADAHGGV